MKKIFFVLLLLLPFLSDAQSGIITTIAGTGVGAESGDGGPATAAQLNRPFGVALDRFGNLFITDYLGLCVRKIDASGTITTVAGSRTAITFANGAPATSVELGELSGIAFDDSGNYYITASPNSVFKVNTAGNVYKIAGSAGYGYSGDGGPATAARVNSPKGVAVDGSGNIYIADANNSVIRKVNTAGIITTVAGNGSQGFSGDGGPATAAELYYPEGVAVDKVGNLFIADFHNGRIRKADTSGVISTVVSGYGSLGNCGVCIDTAALIGQPIGIIVDSLGNMYFTGGDVYKVTTADTLYTLAGINLFSYSGDGGPATDAMLYQPSGVAVDAVGNIYVADYQNNRVRKITPNTLNVTQISQQARNITIFPNPTTTSFVITSTTPITQITITNLLGQTLYTHNYNSEKVQVDVAALPSGVYFIKINGPDSYRGEVRKFLKE